MLASFFIKVALLSSFLMEVVKCLDKVLLAHMLKPYGGTNLYHLSFLLVLSSGVLGDGGPRVLNPQGPFCAISNVGSSMTRLYGFGCILLKLLPLTAPMIRTLIEWQLTKILLMASLFSVLWRHVNARIEGSLVGQGLRHPSFQGKGRRVIYPEGDANGGAPLSFQSDVLDEVDF